MLPVVDWDPFRTVGECVFSINLTRRAIKFGFVNHHDTKKLKYNTRFRR